VTQVIHGIIFRWWGLTAIISLGALTGVWAKEKEIPGFEQIVQRGLIASIDEPDFVPASEAEIQDDAWVMGVVMDGEARAYSLNLLNSHEIVNDVVAGRPIAAVW
jgi:hypothetical protein